MFNIHTTHVAVPHAGIERTDVFATCARTGKTRIIGAYRRLTKTWETDFFLFDFTAPDGERRVHFVDGAGEAMTLAKAAYNPEVEYDLIPTSNVTFIRWQNREMDGADMFVARKRVGTIVEDEHGYDVCFETGPYGDDIPAGNFLNACSEARQRIVDADDPETNEGAPPAERDPVVDADHRARASDAAYDRAMAVLGRP